VYKHRPARGRTRTSEVGARCAPVYTTGLRERTTWIEQAPPGWTPGALPSELRPRGGTPGWNRTSVLCRRRAALSSSELRAFVRSLRQESNPHLGRTKGACLPFTLRRLEGGDGGSRTRSSSVQARCSTFRASSPNAAPRQLEAPGLQPGELTGCSVSASRWGGRPGSNRRRGDHDPGCFRLHHGHHGAGTTGLEPAASRLTSERSARLSYAPDR
jgi:hypothetical protein